MTTVPLSLYIHIPWCVQKCPYCDFNSHQQKGQIPEKEYVANLLDDLSNDLSKYSKAIDKRRIESIFIGGGTPSLLSIEAMESLLKGVRNRIEVAAAAEITMEANPGTVEADKFAGFASAGINRISIGVQSFNDKHLVALGRIHGGAQAIRAIDYAKQLPLKSFNTDIMHGLADQTAEQAMSDLKTSIELNAPHISWYQLTIEPNTLFHSKPPQLPDDEVLWDIQEKGQDLLQQHGYEQYEISAFSKVGQQSKHNLNYWRFGDYLGIGCGAHGKITDLKNGLITRTVKTKHPIGYMDLIRPYLYQVSQVERDELAFEFFMNRFRLVEACPKDEFAAKTGHETSQHELDILKRNIQRGLLVDNGGSWQVSSLGRRYLNSLLAEFV